VLEEFLPTAEDCIVRDASGAPYLNEVIIPLYREQVTTVPRASVAVERVKRTFSPYSEWLYCKVYCGPKTADNLLKTMIGAFVEAGIEAALFERFFFIRYKDDAHHLRIRFYNTDIGKQPAVYKAFMSGLQPFLDQGLVARIVVDTYERETERYGASAIEATETLFHHDSLAVLRFIRLLEGEDMERYRLLFALRGVDMLLDDFGFSLDGKALFLKQLQMQFFTEFGGKLTLQRQLNEQYRKYQKAIFSHMDPANDSVNEIEEAAGIFTTRSDLNTPVLAPILDALPEGFPEGHIHMFMNRLFPARQRMHELVVYHFLEKYYGSKIAMGSRKN
jgi:thiopeptide-type bacteriocin biosynthesis protein